MASLSDSTEPVGNESLDQWEPVGSGGFGSVYKARHKEWGFDVAIKISHSTIEFNKAMHDEAIHMEKASCEFVLRVFGRYLGCPPFGSKPLQQGIVMEFMGRGSVRSLLNDLSGPPPWPLAFRLAHQVALGMNFLHSRKLLHQDLKPSNVLLSDELNAKLADFGLSQVSTSVLHNPETNGEFGGSYKYMPPEAFEASYEPVRAFDRYSYGILLWSILTGKEPYPSADYNLVALRIPKGDRPPCEEIHLMKADGLKKMVDLMKRCWEKEPFNRPTFKECLEITEEVLSKHKKGIHGAVHQVLTKLDSQTSHQHSQTNLSSSRPLQAPAQSKLKDVMDPSIFTKTEEPSVQKCTVTVCKKEMNDTEKANFVDNNRAVLIQDVSEVMALADELGDMVHSETYSVVEGKRTSQERMRVLYQRTFKSGGEKVKAAFYDTLKKHQPELVERLGG